MADESPNHAESLEQQLEVARKDYEHQRRALAWRMQKHFIDASDATDRLLSAVDEYGQQHALGRLAERPDDYGVWEHTPGEPWREVVESLEADIAKLIDAHERLDDLTLALDKERNLPETQRTIHVQGDAYVIDAEARAVRHIATGERSQLEDQDTPQRILTLTERAALRVQLPEQPERPHTRDRTRGR